MHNVLSLVLIISITACSNPSLLVDDTATSEVQCSGTQGSSYLEDLDVTFVACVPDGWDLYLNSEGAPPEYQEYVTAIFGGSYHNHSQADIYVNPAMYVVQPGNLDGNLWIEPLDLHTGELGDTGSFAERMEAWRMTDSDNVDYISTEVYVYAAPDGTDYYWFVEAINNFSEGSGLSFPGVTAVIYFADLGQYYGNFSYYFGGEPDPGLTNDPTTWSSAMQQAWSIVQTLQFN